MAVSTRATGKEIFVMAKALRGTQTVTLILATLKKVKPMARVFTPGPTEKSTTASGYSESSKVTESGRESGATATLASGSQVRLTASVYTLGQMGIVTKVSGTCALSMVRVLMFFVMATPILVSMSMGSLMEEVSTIGLPGLTTQVNFTRVRSRVAVSGEAIEICRTAIPMKVNITMTESMVREFSRGPLETFTKESILRMKDVETARCFGQMVQCMRASG